jgi:hypothetical protein
MVKAKKIADFSLEKGDSPLVYADFSAFEELVVAPFEPNPFED